MSEDVSTEEERRCDERVARMREAGRMLGECIAERIAEAPAQSPAAIASTGVQIALSHTIAALREHGHEIGSRAAQAVRAATLAAEDAGKPPPVRRARPGRRSRRADSER